MRRVGGRKKEKPWMWRHIASAFTWHVFPWHCSAVAIESFAWIISPSRNLCSARQQHTESGKRNETKHSKNKAPMYWMHGMAWTISERIRNDGHRIYYHDASSVVSMVNVQQQQYSMHVDGDVCVCFIPLLFIRMCDGITQMFNNKN